MHIGPNVVIRFVFPGVFFETNYVQYVMIQRLKKSKIRRAKFSFCFFLPFRRLIFDIFKNLFHISISDF